MNINEITILGSGTSTGTPMVGCHCKVCKSNNPYDKRLRSSILLKTKTLKTILIDTTPDLRAQMLINNVDHLDFVIIGHTHADHVHGIDDLRPYCYKSKEGSIDLYTSKIHSSDLEKRFPYIFKNDGKKVLGGGIPRIYLKEINLVKNSLNSQKIQNEKFDFFELPHNYTTTVCFVHGGLAYLPDCHNIPDEIVIELNEKELDLLIIDCLQIEDHDTHLNVERCFEYIKKIKPKRAGLIHMNHHIGHNELQILAKEAFDFEVFPLYDGQVLEYF